MSVIAVIVIGGRFATRIPWALVAVIGAIVASYALGPERARRVGTLGTVPSGLPSLSWPSIPSGDLVKLVGHGCIVFVVVLAQSAATSRAYAAKFDDEFDENVDLVGLERREHRRRPHGHVRDQRQSDEDVHGGQGRRPRRSWRSSRRRRRHHRAALPDRALAYMPDAVLAAVVFLIGVELVDIKGMTLDLRARPVEFSVALRHGGDRRSSSASSRASSWRS